MSKKERNRKSTTFRLSKYTLSVLERLAEAYSSNRTAIVEQAIAYFDQIQKRRRMGGER